MFTKNSGFGFVFDLGEKLPLFSNDLFLEPLKISSSFLELSDVERNTFLKYVLYSFTVVLILIDPI